MKADVGDRGKRSRVRPEIEFLELEDDVNRYCDINDRQGSMRFGR